MLKKIMLLGYRVSFASLNQFITIPSEEISRLIRIESQRQIPYSFSDDKIYNKKNFQKEIQKKRNSFYCGKLTGNFSKSVKTLKKFRGIESLLQAQNIVKHPSLFGNK